MDVLPFPVRSPQPLRSARHAEPLRGSASQRLRAKRSARIHTPRARRTFRVRKFSVLTRRNRLLNSRPHEKRRAATPDVRARTRSRRSGTRASRRHAPTKTAARRARCAAASATRHSPPRRRIRPAFARAPRRTPARRPARASRDRSRRRDTRRYVRRAADAAAGETSTHALRTLPRRFWTVRHRKSCAGAAQHRMRGLVRARLRGTMSALFRLSVSSVS